MKRILVHLLALATMALTACGGGGGKGSSPPPTTTHSISGTVSGAVVAGVTISLTGAATGTTTTDASGNYTFGGLANGSYVVAPSSTGYAFSPVSIAVTVNGANVPGQNFTASAAANTYSISGTVRGALDAGVTVTLSGANSGTTITDVNGDYTFSGLTNGSYTITPGMTGYYFTPTSVTVTVNGANIGGQDFNAALAPIYSISGTVSGAVTQGVTISLTGAATATTTTDSSGNYTFGSLTNGSYVVAPSMTGYNFTPVSIAVTVNGANATGQNFTASAAANTYSISGTVGGATAAGVTITLSGANSGTTITDVNGDYTFSGLTNGSYTITPSKTGYNFTPTSITVTVNGANVPGQNFTATLQTYDISGTVSGAVVAGVTVTLTGAATATTTTDTSGNYTFSGLANGSYAVAPSSTGHTFSPVSIAVTVNGANVSGVNFTASAAANTYSISGTVGGATDVGVTVTLSGANSGTTITDGNGDYTFSGLTPGSYTITPSKTGYSFTPTSAMVTVTSFNVFGIDFTAY